MPFSRTRIAFSHGESCDEEVGSEEPLEPVVRGVQGLDGRGARAGDRSVARLPHDFHGAAAHPAVRDDEALMSPLRPRALLGLLRLSLAGWKSDNAASM